MDDRSHDRDFDASRVEMFTCGNVQWMLKRSQQSSQALPNHPQTPPFASISFSTRGSEQQRLQDVKLENCDDSDENDD